MTEVELRHELSQILADLAEELDVPPSKYQDAKDRYDAVGNWLNEDDSDLAPYDPEIYPQGSFSLGTAVRPLGDEDYDVDAVCLLGLSDDEITQQQLKKMVGDRLKQHGTYARMLEPEGRRCWTLKYADSSKFHLDILPAVPDEYGWLMAIGVPEVQAQHAICITDEKTWNTDPDWPKSNPKGYTEWFKEQMRVILEKRRRIMAMETRADVQQVPDYKVRTPLQRVVQLLKRHRDMKYNGDEDKPISIIITTLAAQAYDNEEDLLDALLNMVPRMRNAIEYRNGAWWVPNPVNAQENFADKWAEKPRKQRVFFEWLDSVDALHQELLTGRGFEKVGQYLTESYGQRDTSAAMAKYASRSGRAGQSRSSGVVAAASQGLVLAKGRPPSRFEVAHREQPKWPVRCTYQVSVTGRYKHNGQWHWFKSDSSPLPKGCDLLFHAKTATTPPFSVYWQVVNTGNEARRVNQLRGQIFPAKTAGVGGLTQKEATAYTGMHWIECFIVRNGECMARSGEFVVNIQ